LSEGEDICPPLITFYTGDKMKETIILPEEINRIKSVMFETLDEFELNDIIFKVPEVEFKMGTRTGKEFWVSIKNKDKEMIIKLKRL
jgi:hypothetical protein